jgi:uncharacterized membrane protein YagU involved in acid resistance
MITLAYIIPNVYVFFRIGRLFINKGFKIYYALIYLLLASVYPLGNRQSGQITGFFRKLFIAILSLSVSVCPGF